MEEKKQANGIGRLLQIAGQKKILLLVSAVLALGHAALALVPYILMYQVMEQLLQPEIDYPALETLLGYAIGAGILSYVLLYISGICSHFAAFHILYQLRRHSAERLGLLSLGDLERYNSGALKKILVDDIERIEGFLAHQIPDFFKGLTLPILTIVYLFYVDWRLAAVSLVPLLFLAIWLPLAFSRPYTKKMMKHYHQAMEDMNSGIVEYIRAIPVMKIFGQSADRFRKYAGTVNEYEETSAKWLKTSAPVWAVFMSFMSNALLPILVLGTWLYLEHGLGLETYFLFLILGVGYIKPLFALSNMGMQITLINRGVQRMDDVLGHPLQTVEAGGQEIHSHEVTFDQVGFSYRPGVKVLEDVSFTVPQGTLTALVGPSGAGKSTVARLVARFWDIQEGEIKIGGRGVNTFSPADLAKKVSYVFQSNFMFHQTLYENIRMGMDKSQAEIEAAARAAQCHDLIKSLPEGYQTRFGDTGIHLSGGEKQRIQLARAILKDAPILILDEATSFSDPENEHLIQKAISRLIAEKTVIVIAHRLNTIVHADQILVFDRGEIVGQGTHQELLVHSPLYQSMWEAHSRTSAFTIR